MVLWCFWCECGIRSRLTLYGGAPLRRFQCECGIRSRGDEALFVCVFHLRDHIFVLCKKYVRNLKKNRNRRISSLVLGIGSFRSPSGFVRSDRIVLNRPCLVIGPQTRRRTIKVHDCVDAARHQSFDFRLQSVSVHLIDVNVSQTPWPCACIGLFLGECSALFLLCQRRQAGNGSL